MGAVTAVVVTYNRKALLREALAALRASTRPADRVLVVDNASTDGTRDMVREEFGWADLLALPENVGGAGGFNAGMRAAYDDGADWVWLMDDDSIVTPDALERLLAGAERAPAGAPRPLLLCSKVVWDDGRLHPMNAPGFERYRVAHLVEGCERQLMALRCATFVSLLVHREAIDRHGLPHAHFFIWSDDIEYTARILRREPVGYLVPDSVVHHKTKAPYTAVSTTGGRFYFHIRNHLYMLRGDAWDWREKLTLIYIMLFTTWMYLRFNRFKPDNVRLIARAVRDGVRPLPA